MSSIRIASGGVQHETNTFAAAPTTLADFARDNGGDPDFTGGDAILNRYRSTGSIHGGIIDAAGAAGVKLLPLLCADAHPGGVVQQEAFDGLLGRFLDRLGRVLPVDGVLLDLHGAMVTDEHEDAEGAFIDAVRRLTGPEVPIFVTLDMHANVTERMARLSDVIVGFQTYPHVDMHDRGREAVELLVRTIRGEVKPVQAYRQLPLLTLAPMQCTLREPMQSTMQGVRAMVRDHELLTATVSMGFPFADIADAGVAVLVTSDDDAALAERHSDELADRIWQLRDDLEPKLTTIEQAVRFAMEHDEGPEAGPVIFADGSDNPGGGAPADGTVALKALIESGFNGAVVGVLCDPQTVAQAHASGVGAVIDAQIGGKTDDRHGEPIRTRARVRTLCDGRFVYRGPMRHGMQDDFGAMARLSVGGANRGIDSGIDQGIDVVVSTNRIQVFDAEMLRIAGVNPQSCRLLVLKSAVHFRADFARFASAIFDGDTPGIHRPDFTGFDYRKLRRPIYPIDQFSSRCRKTG